MANRGDLGAAEKSTMKNLTRFKTAISSLVAMLLLSACTERINECSSQQYANVCAALKSHATTRIIVTLAPNSPAEFTAVAGITLENRLESIPVVTLTINRQGLLELEKMVGIEAVILDRKFTIK